MTLTQFIIIGIRQSCKIYSAGKLPPVAHARKGSELILSTMVHVVRCVYCGDDDCESDDDVGPETMYS